MKVGSVVQFFTAIASLLTGMTLMVWGTDHGMDLHMSVRTLATIAGAALTIIGILLLAFKSRQWPKISLSLSTALVMYWICEGLAIGLTPKHQFPCNRPSGVWFYSSMGIESARFDSIIGYRWKAGKNRITLIAEDEVIYDVTFRANRQGFINPIDFTERKTNQNGLRLMVLGDSYSAGMIHDRAWPGLLQEKWNQSSASPHLQIDNFSIDGGGSVNWNRILLTEIIPKYEFDGVILAVGENALARPFFWMDHGNSLESGGYLPGEGPFSYSQRESSELLWSKPLQGNNRTDFVLDSISANPQRHYPPSFLFFPALIEHRWLASKGDLPNQLYYAAQSKPANINVTKDSIEKWIGTVQFKAFSQVLDTLETLGKKVILVSIPDMTEIYASEKNMSTIKHHALGYFAETWGYPLYEGFPELEKLSKAEAHSMFYKYDYHWNPAGIEHFLPPFMEWMRKEAIPKFEIEKTAGQ